MSLRALRASPVFAAVLAALVALGVRVTLVAHGTELTPDGTFDLEIARDLQLLHGRDAVLRRFHPLEGALTAAVATGFFEREADETSGLVVSVVAGALAAFFVALAASEAFDHDHDHDHDHERVFAALAAGLLVAAHPTLARSAATVWSYPLSHAALAAALYASARSLRRDSLGDALLAGVAAGVGYLARPDGVVLLAGLVAGVLVAALLARRRRLLLAPLLVVLGFSLLAAPYVLALHAVTHEWRLTLKKDERHLVGMRDLQAPPPAPRPEDDLGAIIARCERHTDPEETGLVASALYVLRRSGESVHWLLVALGAVGLVVVRRVRSLVIGGMMLLAFFSAHTLLKANERHFNAQHPSVEAVVFALWGGLALAPLARSRRARTAVLGACVVVLLAKTRDTRSLARTELTRSVAAELRDRFDSRHLVICGREARPLAFLAGARLIEMPGGDAASVVSAARVGGAHLLAIHVRTHGDAPAPVASALEAAGVHSLYGSERFTASRAADGGTILYTWLVYDTSWEKR